MDFLFSSHLKDTLAMTCSGLLRRVKQSKVKRGHIRHSTEEIIKCKGTCQYLPPACFIAIVWVYFDNVDSAFFKLKDIFSFDLETDAKNIRLAQNFAITKKTHNFLPILMIIG